MKMLKGLQPARSSLHLPTVQNMSPTVTINGVTGDTILHVVGNDASISALNVHDYGVQIPVNSTGGDPLIKQYSPFMGPWDFPVQINNAGKVYRASSTSSYNLGTLDFNINIVFRTSSKIPNAGNRTIIAKGTSASTIYWVLYEVASAYTIVFSMANGAVSRTITFPGFQRSTVYCMDLMLDMSETNVTNGMGGYCNGITWGQNSGTASSLSTLSNSNYFTVGALSDLTEKNDDFKLHRLLIATKAGWFPGGAENKTAWLAYHAQNRANLYGLSAPSSVANAYPKSFTRNEVAFACVGGRQYSMGNHTPKMVQTYDGTVGLFLEEDGNNWIIRPADASQWTPTKATLPSSIESPVDGYTAHLVQETTDASNYQHYISSPPYTPLIDTRGRLCILQLLMAPEDRTWIALVFYEEAMATYHVAYYNLATGELNIINGNIIKREVLGVVTHNGKQFHHVAIWLTSHGGMGAKKLNLYTATGSSTSNYIGDGSDGFTFACAQLEVTDAPTIWYKFDEPSGASLTDWSGNDITGTIAGTVSRVPGVHGSALHFNGTDNFISVPIPQFNSSSGTWCCWARADWTAIGATRSRLFNSYDTRGSNYMFRTYCATGAGSNLSWYLGNGVSLYNAAAGVVQNNTWQHFLFTWQYSAGVTSIRGYLNGVYYGVGVQFSGTISIPDISINVGWWQAASTSFIGDIDDFRLYAHVLDDTNIDAVYKNRHRFQKNPSSLIINPLADIGERISDPSLSYNYNNISGEGSKVFDFRQDWAPGGFWIIWRISNSADSSLNSLFGFIDEYGYINAEIKVGGTAVGTLQLAQNVCNAQQWRLAFRWKSGMFDILAYNKTDQQLYTASMVPSDFPVGLDLNEVSYPCSCILYDNKDYDYYEPDNRRLLFG